MPLKIFTMKIVRLLIISGIILVLTGCQTQFNIFYNEYDDEDEEYYYDDYDPWMEDEDYYNYD